MRARAILLALGSCPLFGLAQSSWPSRAEFAAFLRADSAKWADIIRRPGASSE